MTKAYLPSSAPSVLSPARMRGALAALAVATAGAQAFAQSASPSSAGAQQASEAAASPSGWGLGLGVSSRQRPYAEAGSKTSAIPLIYYENSWVRVIGSGAELKLGRKEFGPSNAVSFGLKLQYDIEGYEAKDSPRLRGMEERKDSFWGGAGVTWSNPIANVSAQVLADLSGNSKGQKMQLQLDRRFTWNRLAVTPRVQAQWLDAKYVDYYFGVRSSEALPGRPQYTGESAMAMSFGVRMDYALMPRQSVFLDVSSTRLPDEIKRSPVVDRSSLSRVTVGYLYRF
ncbi:MipA/OmpV family protein [Paracidovorax anthurii]|uniref:Outer membrane protein n=1 Tax=Paracidovorax anthurii TaxID=78229 RepID=A0A328YKY0_9BURK|nr:MipA/OmpV family protein [Paracidovorax anthurii]RAR73964.1 outer membrane protein [Paracidovorax anthurii]